MLLGVFWVRSGSAVRQCLIAPKIGVTNANKIGKGADVVHEASRLATVKPSRADHYKWPRGPDLVKLIPL